jgi:hypothetical protein
VRIFKSKAKVEAPEPEPEPKPKKHPEIVHVEAVNRFLQSKP